MVHDNGNDFDVAVNGLVKNLWIDKEMVHPKTWRGEVEWHFNPSSPGASYIGEAHGIVWEENLYVGLADSSVTYEELISFTGAESLVFYGPLSH